MFNRNKAKKHCANPPTRLKWSRVKIVFSIVSGGKRHSACTQHIRELMTHEIFMVLIDFSWLCEGERQPGGLFRWLRASSQALGKFFRFRSIRTDRRSWTSIINKLSNIFHRFYCYLLTTRSSDSSKAPSAFSTQATQRLSNCKASAVKLNMRLSSFII